MEKENDQKFEQNLIEVRRVARVQAGGRRFSFRAVLIIGDKNGKVGLGLAKGSDVAQAIDKALKQAKKNLIKVATRNGTIPYEVKVKFKSAQILLKPARQGEGLIAGGVIRSIANLAGIKNMVAKVLSPTKNKINLAKATFKALEKLQRYEIVYQDKLIVKNKNSKL